MEGESRPSPEPHSLASTARDICLPWTMRSFKNLHLSAPTVTQTFIARLRKTASGWLFR